MTSPLSAARAFVEEHYPDAVMAFLGGSAATGTATATSDLDVLILLRDDLGDVAFVETTTHQGWLVEAFVYGPVAAEHWIRRGREERRPVLDTLAASGLILTGNAQARDWAEHARRVLAVGPGAPEPADVDRRRYGLSSLVDDLEGSGDPAESYVIAATAWREAAELALLATDRWLATGKWLIRQLRHGDDYGLIRWAAGERDLQELSTICRVVLDVAGGYLQHGFIRGERNFDLVRSSLRLTNSTVHR